MTAMTLAATSAIGAAGSVLGARFKKSGMPSSGVSGALTLTFIVISMGFLSAGALAARRVTHMDQQVRNASEFRAMALLFSGAFDRSMITATDKKTAGLSVGGFDGRSPLTAPHEVDNAGPSFFRPTAARK